MLQMPQFRCILRKHFPGSIVDMMGAQFYGPEKNARLGYLDES